MSARPAPTDQELARLVDGLADAVIVADRDGTVVYWNQAATRIFGWTAAEAVGGPLSLIIPERLRERHDRGYARTMETGITRYGEQLLEVPALDRDGDTRSIAFTVTLLPGDDGRPRGCAAVVRDDTERWQERRELRRRLAELERRGG